MSDGPFSSRSARLLAAGAGVSLVAAGLLAVFGDAFEDVPSSGADSYSRSALGHHAFVRLLRDLGHPVVASRHRTATKTTDATVLVVVEPQVGVFAARRAALEAMVSGASRVLLVLPKRLGGQSPTRRSWLAHTDVFPESFVEEVLEALQLDGEVTRPTRTISGWRGDLPAPALDKPQLLVSADLEPLVWTDEGMLAGEKKGPGWHLVVLADPDVVATHGLGDGANAELAVRLVERLAGDGATLLFDETLHGHEASPSLARELLRWPLALATVQAALALGLLAWAALVRFGRARRPAPALAPGKAFLIENTAGLLLHGGHVAPALAAYWRAAKEQIAQALRAPGERGEALDAWLARTAAARGRTERLGELERRVAALAARRRTHDEAIRTALDVHEFRKEMTDGSGGHS